MALTNEIERSDVAAGHAERAEYEAPVLRALGDIREMTLGGSLGTGDSGNSMVQRF